MNSYVRQMISGKKRFGRRFDYWYLKSLNENRHPLSQDTREKLLITSSKENFYTDRLLGSE